MNIKQYHDAMEKYNFSVPDKCSICGARGTLIKHGYYYRNILDDDFETSIRIPRFYCKCCRHTLSLLPVFCVPHFQYSARFILAALNTIFTGFIHKLADKFKALLRFYKRRFLKNIKLIEMFIRDAGINTVFPEGENERAIKAYQSLISLPREETLFQRFLKNSNKHFMAN